METPISHRLPYSLRDDFKVGRATELKGKNYLIYRFFEILPGFVSWVTLIGTVLASIYIPVFAAYFIIAFSLYWLLKTIFLSVHLRHSWKRVRHHLSLDWGAMIEPLKYEHFYHMVVLPFYEEPEDVIDASIASLASSVYDKQKLIVVLATEARAGDHATHTAARMREKWSSTFGHFVVTVHPDDLEGEIKGKGSNTVWALEEARTKVLETHKIPYKDVIVSVFDIDTVIYPQYFNCLM